MKKRTVFVPGPVTTTDLPVDPGDRLTVLALMAPVTFVPLRISSRRRTVFAPGPTITAALGPVTTDLGASLPLTDPGLPFTPVLGVFAILIGDRIDQSFLHLKKL